MGVADERRFYYPFTGLLKAGVKRGEPLHKWVEDGRKAKNRQTKVLLHDNGGFAGYYTGPHVYMVEPYALVNPLLSRLPMKKHIWRIGHFARIMPGGYFGTLMTGENQIVDENLAVYYDKLALIIRGDLFDLDRLAEIWRMNMGQYDHLIDTAYYFDPPIQRVTLSEVHTTIMRKAEVDWGKINPFYQKGIQIDLEKTFNASRVEISVDNLNTYGLILLDGEKILMERTFSNPCKPVNEHFDVYNFNIPSSVAKGGYNKLRIVPMLPRTTFSLGHVRFYN